MFRWMVISGALLCSAAPTVIAQVAAQPTDPVFVRAQALVSDGNGAAGRALIDSVLKATPPMAPLYPQALYWRASLAASAADAESDYKHIVVDYPLAPQAADALLRLAQLELARGDREGALGHLQRIPRDYPRSKLLPRASYWTARVLFEKNDITNACIANANALAQADTTEIELRNQIQYQGQRCPAAPVVATTAPTPIPGSPESNAVPPIVLAPPASEATASPPAPAPPPLSTEVVKERAPETASTTPKSVAVTKPVQTSRPKPPTEANDAKPSIVDPSKAPKATTPAPKSAPSTPASGYSVQVAAYQRRSDADKLVSSLRERGYSARVDVSAQWFRVRIGRYATERDAEDALKKIKAKHMDGFVVRAPEK